MLPTRPLPSTFRTPISLVRAATVCAARPTSPNIEITIETAANTKSPERERACSYDSPMYAVLSDQAFSGRSGAV
jgi:hypothetical protein